LVSITDNPFGFHFIYYFHFIVIPLLVEPPIVSVHTHVYGCCNEGRRCRYLWFLQVSVHYCVEAYGIYVSQPLDRIISLSSYILTLTVCYNITVPRLADSRSPKGVYPHLSKFLNRAYCHTTVMVFYLASFTNETRHGLILHLPWISHTSFVLRSSFTKLNCKV